MWGAGVCFGGSWWVVLVVGLVGVVWGVLSPSSLPPSLLLPPPHHTTPSVPPLSLPPPLLPPAAGYNLRAVILPPGPARFIRRQRWCNRPPREAPFSGLPRRSQHPTRVVSPFRPGKGGRGTRRPRRGWGRGGEGGRGRGGRRRRRRDGVWGCGVTVWWGRSAVS